MRCLLLSVLFVALSHGSPAHADSQGEGFKQEVVVLTDALDDSVSSIVPGPLLQRSKAIYLDDYGVVVTIEVALERPRNPFSRVKPPDEVRRSSAERREALRQKAVDLLEENVAGLKAVAPDEWVTIAIHMLNTNPADLPDLPTQLVVSARKQDVIDLRSGQIAPAVFQDRLRIREY